MLALARRFEGAELPVRSFLGWNVLEVDHELFRADGQAQQVDRLHGPVAQQAHGVVGDADDPARLDDLLVFGL